MASHIRRNPSPLLTAAIASLLALRGLPASADSLVTTDGDLLVGSVNKTATGYTVLTSMGPVDVPAAHVKKILYDQTPGQTPDSIAGTSAPASPTLAPHKAAPLTPKNLKMLQQLIEQGKTAYYNGSFTDARDAFNDASALDPQNPTANRGLGYAQIKLGKSAEAADPLERLAASQPLDRTLSLTLSASQLAAHNTPRALQLLNTYLKANPTPVDEPAINALGITLAQMQPPATTAPLYADASKLYTRLNQNLEQTQPGKKHWGVDWLPSDEVDQKRQNLLNAQTRFNAAATALKAAKAKIGSAQDAFKTAQNLVDHHHGSGEKLEQARQRLDTATNNLNTAQSAYDAADALLSSTPAPDFPQAIPLDSVELTLDPPAAPPPLRAVGPAVASVAATPPSQSSKILLHATPKSAVHPPDAPPPTPLATPLAEPGTDHVTSYAVAFAIAPDILLTAAAQVEDSTDIQLTTSDGKNLKARVLRDHHSDGIALLQVDGANLPCLRLAAPGTIQATHSMSCLSFPEVDLFNPVVKSIPTAAPAQGDNWTVHMDLSPRLPGAPLLKANQVVGIELGDRDSDLSAIPAANLKQILSLVADSAQSDHAAADPTQAVVQVTAEH
jgi:tetratricopeptide (TPR) repeat protein